jgi:protein SCO1/2
MKRAYLLAIVSALLVVSATAQESETKVGLDEKPGATLPLDLEFVDSNCDTLTLREMIDKPTLILMVYYECPDICAPLMAEVAALVRRIDLDYGTDYQIMSISFDPDEGCELAASKKPNYTRIIKDEAPESAWRFLTGDSASIAELTDAIGFRYQRVGEDFNHPGLMVVVSDKGKIARYLLGVTFLPFDVKMAIVEASENRSLPTVTRVLAFCYSYDPEGRGYTLNFTRIMGVFIVAALGVFATFVILVSRKRKGNPEKK